MQTLDSNTLREERMPSGRSVVVRVGERGEELEVRSPRGDVEVRIVLTEEGPIVTLTAARLELAAPDVAVRCERFEVEASDQMRLRAAGDIRVDGAMIRLNCDEK